MLGKLVFHVNNGKRVILCKVEFSTLCVVENVENSGERQAFRAAPAFCGGVFHIFNIKAGGKLLVSNIF